MSIYIRLITIAVSILVIAPIAQAKIINNKTFGSWSVTCGQQNCAMTQLVTKDEAAEIKKKLEEAGASVELK